MVTTPTSLLQRLREPDDRSAWERFVGLYTPVLYGWVRRCGISVDEASDLVQEVFVTLIAVLPTFEYDRNRGFGSWLRTVAGNKCRDHFRRRAARPAASRGDLDPIGDDPIAELTEDEYRPLVVLHISVCPTDVDGPARIVHSANSAAKQRLR
jgi:RNA polymerase sigma factor (sigma-70 family)